AGDHAGRLIEDAGLKGRRVGGARFSERHANFIVNDGRARATDVQVLMAIAQRAVWERSGVWLEPEVRLRGRWEGAGFASAIGPRGRAPLPGGRGRGRRSASSRAPLCAGG